MAQINLSYNPRWYQFDFETAMLNKKRAVLLFHRRAGKDYCCLNFLAFEAMKKKGIYYYLFPTFSQARRVIWDGIDEASNSFIHNTFPPEIVKRRRNDEMKLELTNGSIIQMVGTDNYDSIRGTNPSGCVFSEYAMQDPRCWESVVSPILRKNDGWAVFNSTPMGKNHFYDLWEMAVQHPEAWYTKKLTVEDTGLITPEQISQERAEGRSEETIQQEYFCSFTRGVEGSYYGKMLHRIRTDGRICRVPYDSFLPVHTYWDLGYGDSTSIVFAQLLRNEIHVIDYYEAHNEGLDHYVKVLQDKGYSYGTHYAPHDVEAGSLALGMTLRKFASQMGLKFSVVPKTSVDYGIAQARALESRLYFDEKKCSILIGLLESYRKKYNDKLNAYSDSPLHDYTSHAADAFRYMAVAIQTSGGDRLTGEKIDEMRAKAGLF